MIQKHWILAYSIYRGLTVAITIADERDYPHI